jgi:hypothetical protein
VKNKVQKVILLLSALFLIAGVFPLPARAQPVHFKELMGLLPVEPPQGWKVSEKPKGATIKSPVQISSAEVEFQSPNNQTLEIHIMDGVAEMLPPTGLGQGMEMESSEEYLKSIEVQGFKGMEKFNHQDKEGEILLPVAGRFMVLLKAEGIENTDILKEFLGKLDIRKLAALAAKEK